MKRLVQLAVRFEGETIREIDRKRKYLEKGSQGVRVTRSDAVRYLVKRGLGKSFHVAKNR